jgi:DNA (cytosine-5)-methyltransferase 1
MVVVDLFCKAGGASVGLHRAFPNATIIGVDIKPQRNYPFLFVLGDALRFRFPSDTAFVWASPPCQKFSKITVVQGHKSNHPDLIAAVRSRLVKLAGRRNKIGYVMENVPGAPLKNPVVLCGSMFSLRVRRHRIFETNFPVKTIDCAHHLQDYTVGVYGNSGGRSKRDGLRFGGVSSWRKAMGIDWMKGNELAEAVPPAYAEYIGRQYLETRGD